MTPESNKAKSSLTEWVNSAFSTNKALKAENEILKQENSGLTSDLSASQTLTKEHEATITRLQAAASTHADVVAAHNTEKASFVAQLAAKDAQLAAQAAGYGMKPEEMQGKSPEEISAAFTARVSARAADQLAELGFAPEALPASGAPVGTPAAENTMTYAEFSALNASDKMKFSVGGGRLVG